MPKFDVVVGNPPYQRNGANPGNPLWPIFSRLGVNSLKENGYICYITPSTWLNGKGIYKDILTKYNTLYINVNECKKYFNTGNNNTYSYWIVQKNKYKNLTLLISKNYITNIADK